MRAEWGRRKLLFEDSQRVLQACTIVLLDSIFFVNHAFGQHFLCEV
jgi:hypothetical protein